MPDFPAPMSPEGMVTLVSALFLAAAGICALVALAGILQNARTRDGLEQPVGRFILMSILMGTVGAIGPVGVLRFLSDGFDWVVRSFAHVLDSLPLGEDPVEPTEPAMSEPPITNMDGPITGTTDTGVDIPWGLIGVVAGGILFLALLIIVVRYWWVSHGKPSAESRAKRRMERDAAEAAAREQYAADLEKVTVTRQKEDALRARWVVYDESLDQLLARPFMRMHDQPEIQTITAALRDCADTRATVLDLISAKKLTHKQTLAYLEACESLDEAISAAERVADQQPYKGMTMATRRKFAKARKLLATVERGGTAAEKTNAYRALLVLLDELAPHVLIPEKSLAALESVVSRPALEQTVTGPVTSLLTV